VADAVKLGGECRKKWPLLQKRDRFYLWRVSLYTPRGYGTPLSFEKNTGAMMLFFVLYSTSYFFESNVPLVVFSCLVRLLLDTQEKSY
jgi:hypothetical protein